VSGLDSLKVRLGGQELALKLADAVELTCEAQATADSVAYTIIATVDGKEVGRLSDTLRIATPVPADLPRVDGKPAGGDLPITVAPLKQDKEERPLPSAMATLCSGGGGRFLLLHLPRERKLAVFDVNEAKVTKYLPVGEDDIKFAAGRDKLIVYLPTANVFQRWDLKTLEKEATVTSPAKGAVRTIAMGSASAGPLVVGVDQGLLFFDPLTFKEIGDGVRDQNGQKAGVGVTASTDLRLSADSSLITFWTRGSYPMGFNTLVRQGSHYRHRYEHAQYGWLLPSPDGRIVYSQDGVYSPEGKLTGKKENNGGRIVWYLPALHGPYYLSFWDNGTKKPGEGRINVFLHLEGDQRPLVTVPPVNEVDLLRDWQSGDSQPFDRHMVLIPDAQLLVVIPASKDKLLLYRLSVDQLLEKAEVDYLFVQSQPVRRAEKGSTYAYPVAVRSKKGGVKMKLESGPAGMKLVDNKLT
jgi:hypothetical protein